MDWNNDGGGGGGGGGGDNIDPIAGGGGGELDAFSFDDSDRFEDDSVCSWISEPESVVNNWRGWRKPSLAATGLPTGGAPLLAAPLVGAASGNCGKIRDRSASSVPSVLSNSKINSCFRIALLEGAGCPGGGSLDPVRAGGDLGSAAGAGTSSASNRFLELPRA